MQIDHFYRRQDLETVTRYLRNQIIARWIDVLAFLGEDGPVGYVTEILRTYFKWQDMMVCEAAIDTLRYHGDRMENFLKRYRHIHGDCAEYLKLREPHNNVVLIVNTITSSLSDMMEFGEDEIMSDLEAHRLKFQQPGYWQRDWGTLNDICSY